MKSILIIAFAITFICIFFHAKNENTEKQQVLINKAIFEYHCDLISKGLFNEFFEPVVDYKDMESYNRTFRRLWDWGYKRILPRDKYLYIKQYIEKVK